VKVVLIVTIIFFLLIPTSVFAEEIPSWIKDNAGWWVDKQIDDETFVNGIEYLINEEIIVIPQTQQGISESQEIPSWIKNDVVLWIDDKIDDDSFLQGIQFLIKEGIIEINQKFDENLINFAIAGDFAVNSNTKKNLKNIEKVNPEIILFVGDLRNDNGSPAGWFKMTEFLGKDRIRISIGNHDIIRDYKDQYLTYYNLPKEFYSFDFGNAHFIILATDSSISIAGEQFQFLVTDLQSAKNNPDVDWIIVGLHMPIYSDGMNVLVRSSNNLVDLEHMIEWRTIVQPLFDNYGVDLVLQGHNQFYERFKPLSFDSIVTDNNSSNYVDPQGQIYVTVGTGGHKIHEVPKKENLSEIQHLMFGFLNLKLTPDGKTLNGEFISLDEEVIDKFQIVKQKSKLKSSIDNLDLSSPNKDFSNYNLFLYDLSNLDLSNTNLENAILTYANLTNADLTGANLRGANLQGANLYGTDLSGTDLTGANLSLQNLSSMDVSSMILDNSILFGTKFKGNDLSGKDLSGLNLKASNFYSVDFSYTDLSFAHLTNSFINLPNFSYTNIKNGHMDDAIIHNADFSNSNISGVNFHHSFILNSDFRDTELKGIDLSNSMLMGSIFDFQDLRHVDLTNADLSMKIGDGQVFGGTSLIGVDLHDMDLRSVIFSRDNAEYTATILREYHDTVNLLQYTCPDNTSSRNVICGVNLSGANLSGANLSEKNKSEIDNLVRIKFYETNLSNSNLSGSDLALADLRGANLSGANLSGANLSGANLSGANLSGANLSGAILDYAILDCMQHTICN